MNMRMTRPGDRRRRAFSLIEMLVALTITSTLLTAALAALDASFKAYKVTTDGASTNVVSRIVMGRVLGLIRTGSEFAPYPADVLNPELNPLTSTFMEFVTRDDESTGERRVVRIERRDASGNRGPYELYYIQMDYQNGTLASSTEAPLLSNVESVSFKLQYDVGPRLTRATIDLLVKPDDTRGDTVHADLESGMIRLVASVIPRKLDE